jgi:HD-GYP domain-containing protein (c-di-GMP phosphodiesterase class II)
VVTPASDTEGLRLAELMAALSLATDLGMGQPLEQALRTCLIALRLATLAKLPTDDLPVVYYGALLRFVGCTADRHETARVTGDDIAFRRALAPVFGARMSEAMRTVVPAVGHGQGTVARVRLTARFLVRGLPVMREGVRAHCEVGVALATSLGLSEGIHRCLRQAFEAWNGHGFPDGVRGDAIVPAARVLVISRDLEVLGRTMGRDAAATVIARRGNAGTYDPALAELVGREGASILAEIEGQPAWESVIESEPEPRPWFPASKTDRALEAFADFADLKMTFTVGHSRAVAALAARADPSHALLLRRAALLQDLGRVTVPNPVWEKAGPLSSTDWEVVRLHPYYSERVLSRCSALAALAEPTGMHHERMNGSGYHRGLHDAAIPAPVRTLAAADAYQAMVEPRPHRPVLPRQKAAAELQGEVRSGRLDGPAVEAVLEAAGHPPRSLPSPLPEGLTEREVEVLRLIARSASKKAVAAQLHIAPATVDHHVRHIYEKLGVATRAGAAIFALQHGLIGAELPK